MTTPTEAIEFADAVADWYITRGEELFQSSDLLNSIRHYEVAAYILTMQNRFLSSPRLEQNLRLAAECVHITHSSEPSDPPIRKTKETCLHVASELLPAGGISSMIRRWIELDTDRSHCIAVLDDPCHIPPDLANLVTASGGSIFKVHNTLNVMEKSAWVRSLSLRVADYVILHSNPSDILYTLAFGVSGGPPVVYVNHAAHLFWVGASVSDVVANLRGSEEEMKWARSYRGIANFCTLPIALPTTKAIDVSSIHAHYRVAARKLFRIPQDSVCLITVGSSFKFIPHGNLDFLGTIEHILHVNKNAFFIAAGFEGGKAWQAASERVGGRIKTLGVVSQERLSVLHEAADIYIEGFPFGTTTALLEAGLKGIPTVLPPKQCPPPYASDGIALAGVIKQSEDIGEYVSLLTALINDSAQRYELGKKVQESIKNHHTGPGWINHLNNLLDRVKFSNHSVQAPSNPIEVPTAIYEHWASLVEQVNFQYTSTCERSLLFSLHKGFMPKIDSRFTDIMSRSRTFGGHIVIAPIILIVFVSYVSKVIPLPLSMYLYRMIIFVLQPRLISRTFAKISNMIDRNRRQPTMYADYRNLRVPHGSRYIPN